MKAPGDGPLHLAVVGAGTMGIGISTLAVGQGLSVTLVDVAADTLETAPRRVHAELRMAHLMAALPRTAEVGRLKTADSMAGLADADVVIEAITESLPLKVKVQAEIAEAVPAGVLRVSNTSSIPIDEIADQVDRPEDLVGIHFMNPTYLIRTVEVIRGPRTGDQAMGEVRTLLQALDRTPIVVGDGPGFVTSRVLHRMINDAAALVEEGRATAEDVDALMMGCLGHPVGPLRTADLIGIDNLVDSLWVLHERTGDEGCRPSELLLRKVADGEHGRKTGRGFFDYGLV